MDASRKKTPPDAPDAPLAAVAAAIATHWPETLLRSGQSHVEVALSGGVDSVVLLCALSSLATARGAVALVLLGSVGSVVRVFPAPAEGDGMD